MPCMVEIFAIPLLYYYRNTLRIPQKDLIGVILFIILGIFVGLLNPVYTFTDILPIARCFMLGAIGFIIAKRNNVFNNIDNLYIFCFGVFVGDLINAFLLMHSVLNAEHDKEYAVDINIVFSVLWVILTILYKKDKYLILVFTLVPLLSFISVSRGVSTFFLTGIILAFMLKLRKRPSKIVLITAFLSISYITLSTVYINSEDTVRRLSPSMHFRMYKKVQTIGQNDADYGRFAPYMWAANNITYYIVPRGFLGKKFLNDSKGENTPLMAPWDSTYMELLYTFGLFLVVTFIFIYLYKLHSCYILYICTGEIIFAVSSTMLILLFFEYLFTYGLIRSPFTVISNAGVLGFIWRITNEPGSASQYFTNSNN